jgi:hypothetical protein
MESRRFEDPHLRIEMWGTRVGGSGAAFDDF